jgi:gamma-glutamylaminecyclotransferase
LPFLFVYGTLKEGFPNHHLNIGRRVPGVFRTKEALPLLVVRLTNEERAPWLLESRGQGFRVKGQIFEIQPQALAAIDAFEEVGKPTGYARIELELESEDRESSVTAFAYVKQQHQLENCLHAEGPFEEYTVELSRGYWIAAA